MARFGSLLLTLALTTGAMAQTSHSVLEGSTLEIDGTSNKSDWTVTASEMTGSFEVEEGAVVAAEFSVASNSITGTSGVIQKRLITGALKTSQHPQISYTLAEVVSASQMEGHTELSTRGTLEIAGTQKEIEMTVIMTPSGQGYRFTGSHPVDMTDYRIKPPTALFGSLHVAKEVTVRFDVQVGPGETAESGQ